MLLHFEGAQNSTLKTVWCPFCIAPWTTSCLSASACEQHRGVLLSAALTAALCIPESKALGIPEHWWCWMPELLHGSWPNWNWFQLFGAWSVSETACSSLYASKSTSAGLLQWFDHTLAFQPHEPEIWLETDMEYKAHSRVLMGWMGEVRQLHCHGHPNTANSFYSFVGLEEHEVGRKGDIAIYWILLC